MQTMKTDQTGQTGRMPRLIWVFAGCAGDFVGFVILRLIWYYFPFIFCLSQDPVKEGERKIKQDFDELYEEMQTGFRNLED